MALTSLDYLEKIAMIKAVIQGQKVLEEIQGHEPDVGFYEKQRSRILELDRKIRGESK